MTTTSPLSPIGDISKVDISSIHGLTPRQDLNNDGFWSSNPLFYYLNETYSGIQSRRQSMNLNNPGTMEGLTKEISRDVFSTNYFFTGLRADLNKSFGMDPVFQTSHTFTTGSKLFPPYAFGGIYASNKLFIQGNIDNSKTFSGRFNYGWGKNNISKVAVQIAEGQPPICVLEQDFQANDCSINIKAQNPSILEGEFTGTIIGSVLQSVTPQLALGIESVYNAAGAGGPPEAATNYVARYNANEWIATAQLQAQGAFVSSFWRRVSDKLQAGIETQLAAGLKPAQGGYEVQFEGNTTLGARYDFRQSVFRGQVDNKGKISCFLERKVLPTVSVMFCTEIDHLKNTSRLGLGLQFESMTEELMMMQQNMDPTSAPPVQPPV